MPEQTTAVHVQFAELQDERARVGAVIADLRRERDQLVLDLGNMRGIAQGNQRHVATLTAILEAIEQAEPKMHLRQDGACWPDCPGCMVRAALNTSVTAPVPGSSRRAPEPAEPAPAMPAPGEHLWERFGRLTSCRWCGIIERYDGANKPCKGRVHVELRAAECRDLLSAQHAVVRAAIIWRKMRAGTTPALAGLPAAALIEAVDALTDALPHAGESQASEPAPDAPKLAQGGIRP